MAIRIRITQKEFNQIMHGQDPLGVKHDSLGDVFNNFDPKERMHDEYLESLLLRITQMKDNLLTGRLVLDIRDGLIHTIQDQLIINGVSTLSYYNENVLNIPEE